MSSIGSYEVEVLRKGRSRLYFDRILMKKPVICHLSDFSPEYPGSFVDSLLSLARHCRRGMGIETLCVFPDSARERPWLKRFQDEAVKYAFVPRKKNAILALRNALKDLEPVIFHSHFERFDLSTLLLKLVLYSKAKVVWHFHSVARQTFHQQMKDTVKARLLGRYFADSFVAVGDGAYRVALDRGFPREKLVLNRNGIDTGRFQLAGKTCRNNRASLGVPNQHLVFFALGLNPVIKGVDLFVRAAERVGREGMERGCFIIVGRSKTRAFVSSMPESDRLGKCLRVIDTTDDFPSLLNGIDVLVASSRTEGLSYAVLEAMAAGKLILCSDIPGVREIFGGVEGVWLFPSEDWTSLAQLMQKAMKLSPTERERLGLLNSQYVATRYSVDGWAKRMMEIYNGLFAA